MNSSDDTKTGRPGGPFDFSDDLEDTDPDALAARRRRLLLGGGPASDATVELLRHEQIELNKRLVLVEGRLTTLVDRVIDLMISDQSNTEALVAVKKELAETKEELRTLVAWIQENAGP